MNRTPTTTLEVTRTVAATPAEVFAVWLDKDSPGGPWFGAGRVILNAVVDGLFFHSVDHEGRTWAHYGRFVRLDAPNVIEHTWMSEATQGFETTVTVTLVAEGDKTRVTLTHKDVPDDKMGRQHLEGWGFVLSMIEERFARRKP